MLEICKKLFKPDEYAMHENDEIEDEPEYRNWWTKQFVLDLMRMLPQHGFLMTLFCVYSSSSLFTAIVHGTKAYEVDETVYNVVYTVVVVCLMVTAIRQHPAEPVTWFMKVGFVMDVISYLHCLPYKRAHVRIICYFIRLHRPLRFIYVKDSDTINSNLLVTALKYFYYTLLLRLILAYFYVLAFLPIVLDPEFQSFKEEAEISVHRYTLPVKRARNIATVSEFKVVILAAVIVRLNKVFLPIGPEAYPLIEIERVLYLVVMIIGMLVVSGAAVASLSSVISVYMRPKEHFRTRNRIIMKDLNQSAIPESLRTKVKTFYKMYWHKQRAVSTSQLLPSFPPVLPNSVYTDIYFEATQKSGLLRDLSYLFLCELAQHMETVFYIPGDCIIKRNSMKDSIIFISYGDIEMLTAEDDDSAMLRFTRGTILTPWGGCPAGGGRAHVQIRAGTFCAARVLRARDLWRVALRCGRQGAQTRLMLAEWRAHLTKVQRHYVTRRPNPARYKSSIQAFKKNLMALKEARGEDGTLLLARPDYLLEIAGCYLMRNRADAAMTSDADPICLRQTFPCILQPESSLLTTWNWLVACLILIVCLIYPYYIVYLKTVPVEFHLFDIIVVAIYVLDIIVYLSTGTNVEEGVPITFMETAAKQVQSPWFWVDVLATAPLFTLIGDGKLSGINRVLRFGKVIYMIQSLEEEWGYNTDAVRFVVCFLLLLFACYFLAMIQQTDLCGSYGHCLVTNFTHRPNWSKAPLDDDTVDARLLFSLYCAISMITFTCHIEIDDDKLWTPWFTWYVMVAMEVCIWLSIAIETVYSATIMVTTAFRESFDSCIKDGEAFLDSHQLPLQLRQRFIDHLLLCWNTKEAYSMAYEQKSVYYDLPIHVYQDILARLRNRFLLTVPFIKLLHKEQLSTLSAKVRLFYCAPNEILLNTGDISSEMFIIKQGFCEVLNPDTKEVVGTLKAKDHFGVLECLFRLPAFYTVRTTTHVMIISIPRKILPKVLEVPKIKDAINFAKEQEEYTRLQTRREPFVSYQPPPRAPSREHFRLARKFEKDNAFREPFNKFGFFAILRAVFPRFTFRPDSALLIRYEVCRSFCALTGAFVFPGYSYLVLQLPALYYVTLALDLSAYCDIIFRMFVGFFNTHGVLVYHPANTAARYLRGAFILDLFSCLPLEGLEVSMKYSYGDLYQVTAMTQVLMLNRLLQLYRLPSTVDMLTSFARGDVILVLKALPFFLTLINVMTTLLVFCSVRVYESQDRYEWALVPFDDPGGSWIHLFHDVYRFNVTATPWSLHLGCYFWIAYEATTTGYNTLKPTNLRIMGVLCCTMVLGSLISIYMSVRIISLRSYVNNALANYQGHMHDLVQFMRQENLDHELQKEVIDYYEFNWEKTKGIDARNVLKLCGQITIRTDVILHLYGAAFTNCPILCESDASLFRLLGRAIRSIYFLEGSTIFEKDDVIRNLYFVYSGRLQIRTSEEGEGVSNNTNLGIGSMAGNLDNTETARMPSWLVADSDVHLLQMRSTLFHDIVDEVFPEVLRLMAVYRRGNEIFINANTSINLTDRQPLKRHIMEISRRLAIMSRIIQIFLIITSLLCVYTDVYNAGFQNNSVGILVALYVFDACFLVKIFLYVMMPSLVTLPTEDHQRAKKTYFKGIQFVIDIASCVPIEVICFSKSFADTDFWVLLSWLRLNRMLRLFTVYKYLKRYEKRATENLVFSTVTLVMWFTVCIHCFTSLWFFIGLSIEREEPKQSWFYTDEAKGFCANKYLCSVYFVLMCFAHNGVSEIMPRKKIEVVYVSVLLIISKLIYVVYLGEFSNIVHYASFRAFRYYTKFMELQDYLKYNSVSPVLVEVVRKYAVWLWRTARGEQMPEFLVKSPFCLKLKIMNHAYKKHVEEKHPVFKYCEPALIRHIVGFLRQYYYDENMYVVKQSEITNSMYVVHTGEVQEISENYDDDEDEGVNLKVYTVGEFIGVAQGLIRDKPFDYSYRTKTKSKILTLNLDDWEYLLKHFPESNTLIDDFRRTVRRNDRDDDMARNAAAGPQPPPGPDTSATLGNPGRSESLRSYRWRQSDETQDGLIDRATQRADTSRKSEDVASNADPHFETKQMPYSKTPKTFNADERSLIDDLEQTPVVKREPKLVQVKKSPEEMGAKNKSTLRMNDNIHKLESTPVRFDVNNPLTTSSSTQLFERIRNAAKEVDIRRARQSKQEDDETQSTQREKQTLSIPHHSIEEYLAYKYKMRESYAYNPKRDDVSHSDEDDVNDAGARISPRYRQRKGYLNVEDVDNREHFEYSQLAEFRNKEQFLQNQVPVNLEKPLGDSNITVNISRTDVTLGSNVHLRERNSVTSTIEVVDSQVPMTSKEVMKLTSEVDSNINNDINTLASRSISADNEENLIATSDNVIMIRTPATTELVETEGTVSAMYKQRQSVALLDLSNTETQDTRTALLSVSPTTLLALPAPSSEQPLLEPGERATVETQMLTEYVPPTTLAIKLKEFFDKVYQNLSRRREPAIQPIEHEMSEIQKPTEVVFTEQEPPVSSINLQETDNRLLEVYKPQNYIVALPDDNATDLAALGVVDIVQTTNNTQLGDTTSAHSQTGEETRGTDSNEENTDADSSKPGQDQPDEKKTDRDKDKENHSKEHKEKKD